MNKLSLYVLKSNFMIIGSRQRMASLEGNVDLSVGGYSLKRVQQTKCLGVHIDQNPGIKILPGQNTSTLFKKSCLSYRCSQENSTHSYSR